MKNFQPLSTKALVETNDWYIAAIFFLTAGFIMPWLVGVLAIHLYFSGGSEYLSRAGLGGGGLGLVITYMTIYLTVLYVAKLIERHYVVRSPKRIAIISTGYFIVLLVPWYAYQYFSGIAEAGLQEATTLFMVFRLLSLGIFALTLYSSIQKNLRVSNGIQSQ